MLTIYCICATNSVLDSLPVLHHFTFFNYFLGMYHVRPLVAESSIWPSVAHLAAGKFLT